jgi:hypothetical protein
METEDFREVPIESLTKQQISSRLHLLDDSIAELRAQLKENMRIATALQAELNKRQTQGK